MKKNNVMKVFLKKPESDLLISIFNMKYNNKTEQPKKRAEPNQKRAKFFCFFPKRKRKQSRGV